MTLKELINLGFEDINQYEYYQIYLKHPCELVIWTYYDEISTIPFWQKLNYSRYSELLHHNFKPRNIDGVKHLLAILGVPYEEDKKN